MQRLFLASLFALAPIAVAQSPIVTTMVGGLVLTGFAGSNTVYFDVTVANAAGLIITQFDLQSQAGPAGTVNVFRTAVGGTHVPNHTSAAAWTQVGTASVTAVAPSVAVLNAPFALAPGTYGIAIQMVTVQAVYTNPATPVPPLPTSFSNADVTINCVAAVVQNSTAANAFTGGLSAVRTPNLRMYYTVGTRTAAFTATPRTGSSPLNVQFTDASLGSPSVLAWSWDLDGDSVIDSTLQNPSFIYPCGTYNVSLTVTDANGQSTDTKTGYIVVDPLTAGFTFAPMANPHTFQFTNTSTGAATYAWDLDGDNLTDSTLQNPIWAYAPGCNGVTVKLTASNSCRTANVSQQLAPRPAITTLFNANNAGATGWGNFFDITVTKADGISVCALAVSTNDNGGVPFSVDLWLRPGTYVGFDGATAGWTLAASGNGTSAGINRTTVATLNSQIYLAPGVYGAAVYMNGTGAAYSGLGTSPAPGANSYTNGEVTLTLGVARNGLFGAGVTQFTPRIWNGSIYYQTVDQNLAVYRTFGAGCAGGLGVPGNVATSLPKLGQNLSVNITNLPVDAAFFLFGWSNTTSLFGPLPLDLTPFGAPGCLGRVSPDAVLLIVGAPASHVASYTLGIPNLPIYLGNRFFTGALSIDPAANALGATSADAASVVIGQ